MSPEDRQKRIVERAQRVCGRSSVDPLRASIVAEMIQAQQEAVADALRSESSVQWLTTVDQYGAAGAEHDVYAAIEALAPPATRAPDLHTHQLTRNAEPGGRASTIDGRVWFLYDGQQLRLVAAVGRDVLNFTRGVIVQAPGQV